MCSRSTPERAIILSESTGKNGGELRGAAAEALRLRARLLAQAREFFAQRGISRDEALSCIADEAKATQMAEQMQSWNSNYEITGTPTIYINGNPAGVTSWDAVKQRLEAMGAR